MNQNQSVSYAVPPPLPSTPDSVASYGHQSRFSESNAIVNYSTNEPQHTGPQDSSNGTNGPNAEFPIPKSRPVPLVPSELPEELLSKP